MNTAVSAIQRAGLIVYPTEAVYGIGCDFGSEVAVRNLLGLKQRAVDKGLILIGSHLNHLLPLIKPTHPQDLARALKTWPGPHTWIFPASDLVPDWIRGGHSSVAIRLSAHPTVKALCDAVGHALVSTSANISGHDTPADLSAIQQQWGDAIDVYVDEPLGGLTTTSSIRVAASGAVLR